MGTPSFFLHSRAKMILRLMFTVLGVMIYALKVTPKFRYTQENPMIFYLIQNPINHLKNNILISCDVL